MRRRFAFFLALLAGFGASCPGAQKPSVPAIPPGTGPVLAAAGASGEHKGLVFRLSEGTPAIPTEERAPAVPSTPLGAAETKAVLDRLPPFERAVTSSHDEKFALRERSPPPPRPGKTVTTPFPPQEASSGTTEAPPAASQARLEVLRFSPSGDVPLAARLSVTFNQPMVAVTSQAAAARERPVRLTPEPPGRWRWIGTRTIVFDPAPTSARAAEGNGTSPGRFPMATDYTVEIPAGTRSLTGGTLAQVLTFRFSTPPPTVVAVHPQGGPTRRDPTMFVAFDQKIVPEAVLRSITVSVGSRAPSLRLATPDEIAADESVRRLAAEAEPGRWLAFRATEPLPADSAVTLRVGPGTPSAEGPKTSREAQTFSFRTYGPLRVVEKRCGYDHECPPSYAWNVRFSNPIDPRTFDAARMVRVEPPLPGMKVQVWRDSLVIVGRKKGRTSYRVTFAATLPDAFGQTLGRPESVEFRTTEAHPQLYAPGGPMTVLDPAGGKSFSVFSVNHAALDVRVWAVTPADWPAFVAWESSTIRDNRWQEPPGRKVLDTRVRVEGDLDALTETRIDLRPAIRGDFGHVILHVVPAEKPKTQWETRGIARWIQATRIGLAAFADAGEVIGWATDLADGKPLSGVELSLAPDGPRATTDPAGLATLSLAAGGGPLIVARRGDDVALLPEDSVYWGGRGWQKGTPLAPQLAWYVADDRHMYRPGEKAYVKGWLRVLAAGETGDLRPLDGAATRVSYTLRDSFGNEVTKGSAPLGAMGGFHLELALPPTMNLGWASLELRAQGGPLAGEHEHGFEVQEFRRPEFEVTTSASEGPHRIGGHAIVTVNASYYAGGALPFAETTWRVQARPGSFSPPGRGDYTFGRWVPWWGWDRREGGESDDAGEPREQSFSGKTDSSGAHHLRIDFDAVRPPQPMTVTAEATVLDVNRQAGSSQTTLLVHPALLYVGLKTERYFVSRGEPLDVDAIVCDLDGALVSGRPIAVRAARLEWVQERGEMVEKEVDVTECAVTSGDRPVRCTFRPKEGGTYRITAVVRDDAGRPNETQILRWVAGGNAPPERGVERQPVTVVPDKPEYTAGDVARLLVLAPFSPAEGTLSIRRDGILEMRPFSVKDGSATLEVELKEEWSPNVHLQVDLVGAAPRTNDAGQPDPRLPRRPAYGQGSISIAIPPRSRTLSLEARPREPELEPSGQTVVDVAVRDAAGRPVAGAEVAVVVVDEAILALTGYRWPDPIAAFYPPRGPGAQDTHLRAHVLLAPPGSLAGKSEPQDLDGVADVAEAAGNGAPTATAAPGAVRKRAELKPSPTKVASNGAQPPIAMRQDFRALALFQPEVPTDRDGRARLTVKLPDTLTRYRVMAIATDGARRFGSAESTITARLPLMVRPSPPRFLRFGDRFELPVVVQNQTGRPMQVDVAVRAANAEPHGQGQRVTVPARDRVEVRFAAAAALPGEARFQIGAVAGRHADAALVSMPVWTPATTEAFATYGTISDDDPAVVRQPVQPPADAVEPFGGLEITTSSTQLQALTDAVLYLVRYPFECSEQIASRLLAIAALRDVLTAFQAEGLPPREELVASVARDVEALALLQNEDGGWSFWRRGDPTWPYVSIHIAHALARAREKGFSVPPAVLSRATEYLRDIEQRIPHGYDAEARRSLVAYALYVRKLVGDADPARARRLLAEAGGAERMNLEALGWVYSMLAGDGGSEAELSSIRRHLANRVEETAAGAHFSTSYSDGGYLLLHSDRRVDAVLLEALLVDRPRSDLVPKLVTGLLAHRKAGRWKNTQENAFVLLALDRYFHVYESVTPSFVARVWLGGRLAGEHRYEGRQTDRQHFDVPMRWLAAHRKGAGDAGGIDVILAKEGKGRLYYRIGMTYAPRDLRPPPADHGFTVERLYEPVDAPGDVRRDPDGTWRIRAGARVRVRVTMVAPARRYHVALVDPLPAGLEPLNPALRVTGAIPQDPKAAGRDAVWWWTRTWYEHENLRDDRAEAFASLLWEGVHEYTYVARATTPGVFVVPPARAEEMYQPETFGRSGGTRVIVE